MVNEAIAIIGAGSHTVAWTLTIASYHILANPSIQQKLTSELRGGRAATAGAPIAQVLAHLEKLPYLTATLKEALRFSYGVSIRLARRAPDEDLACAGWTIPRGTPVSMTHALLQHDERVFPDSWAFVPDRWLAAGGALDPYLVAFSGGSRICLGINLAWAEMYLCLAAIFQMFDGEGGTLRLFETTEVDVRMAKDLFLPEVADGSKGVRVLVE
jgi:cytochrome P450